MRSNSCYWVRPHHEGVGGGGRGEEGGGGGRGRGEEGGGGGRGEGGSTRGFPTLALVHTDLTGTW